jgi:hypothetical protein
MAFSQPQTTKRMGGDPDEKTGTEVFGVRNRDSMVYAYDQIIEGVQLFMEDEG